MGKSCCSDLPSSELLLPLPTPSRSCFSRSIPELSACFSRLPGALPAAGRGCSGSGAGGELFIPVPHQSAADATGSASGRAGGAQDSPGFRLSSPELIQAWRGQWEAAEGSWRGEVYSGDVSSAPCPSPLPKIPPGPAPLPGRSRRNSRDFPGKGNISRARQRLERGWQHRECAWRNIWNFNCHDQH